MTRTCCERFFAAIQELNAEGLILAYHDRSDGGLFVTLCEMAFAGRCGLELDLDPVGADDLSRPLQRGVGRRDPGPSHGHGRCPANPRRMITAWGPSPS